MLVGDMFVWLHCPHEDFILFILLFLSLLKALEELFGKNKIILRGTKGLYHHLVVSIPSLIVI